METSSSGRPYFKNKVREEDDWMRAISKQKRKEKAQAAYKKALAARPSKLERGAHTSTDDGGNEPDAVPETNNNERAYWHQLLKKWSEIKSIDVVYSEVKLLLLGQEEQQFASTFTEYNKAHKQWLRDEQDIKDAPPE
jgi:hypothetical protein